MNQREAIRSARSTYSPILSDKEKYYTYWRYNLDGGGFGHLRINLCPVGSGRRAAYKEMRRAITIDALYLMNPEAENQVILGGPLGRAVVDTVTTIRSMDCTSVREMVSIGARIYKKKVEEGSDKSWNGGVFGEEETNDDQ